MRISAEMPVRASRCRATVQAKKLLDLVELDASRHQILQENLATYLHNLREAVPDGALKSMKALESWLKGRACEYEKRATDGGLELSRWPSKILRDLQTPYTDRQVGQRLRRVSRSLECQVRRLRTDMPGYPRSLMAFGGPLHGRFGGHSDADYLYRDPVPRAILAHPLATGFPCAPENFDARLARLGTNDVVMGGPAVRLHGRTPWKAFERLVLGQLERKGLLVDDDWNVQRVSYPRRLYEDRSTARERARPLPE